MSSASCQFVVEPNAAPAGIEERHRLMSIPEFGVVFTDHMVTIRFSIENGWHDARLVPYAPLSLDPASAIFHYGQEVFEGTKAYRTPDGGIVLFRPDCNARRFNASAERMGMPAMPENLFIEALERLVSADAAWVPEAKGASLYLRPFMIALDKSLSVRPSRDYLFVVIASPVKAYFAGPPVPLKIWVTEEFTRAAQGGTGFAKCGGNYAASMKAQAEAAANNCDQVLFLDAVNRSWIEELGLMNIFFVLEGMKLITPPLNGTILPGVTRDSIIHLAAELGFSVEERLYAFSELCDDALCGRLKESFVCGTGAVVAEVGQFQTRHKTFTLPDRSDSDTVAQILRKALVSIQRCEMPDTNDWIRRVSTPRI